ncbi:hypothetical protein PAXRUDRAFT_825458 [Paxillus rubicundulus Ve08.2h10]|uniref:Uncharacterized protein n=1 Tax=Paxillus rubicundulus Ve08.2h10 TaxID=930991 RepID=A0A0D0DT76_9AGAM|nr:hypothetical protein PAXRUDRAFT_825458 [Paxillus rubicundulus Ve08.2h10]
MSGSSSHGSPPFSGEPVDLLDSFEHFAQLAEVLTAERCKTILRYHNVTTTHFWITFMSDENN